jgi:hypothetical protein
MLARHNLSLAQHLLAGVKANTPISGAGGAGAPECRCAISRAYYALYNEAVAYLDGIGFEPENNHNCHSAVQLALNNSGDKRLEAVYQSLESLHRMRRLADYEMKNTAPEKPPNAEACVKMAEQAIQGIDTVKSDVPAQGTIATTIKQYFATSHKSGLRVKKVGR